MLFFYYLETSLKVVYSFIHLIIGLNIRTTGATFAAKKQGHSPEHICHNEAGGKASVIREY